MEPISPAVTSEQLTLWADSLLHINHLNTLVQREIAENSLTRATDLSERARKRAWIMLNEMIVGFWLLLKELRQTEIPAPNDSSRPTGAADANPSLNTDVPCAGLRRRSGPPVSLFRWASMTVHSPVR